MSDFDIKLLYAALDNKRASRRLSWNGVAKEIEDRFAKASPSTIGGIREKQFAEGDGVLQMLLWLGRSPESFVPRLKLERKYQLIAPDDAVLRFDVKRIYRLLDTKRLDDALTWEELADQIGGFSSGALRRLEKWVEPRFPGLCALPGGWVLL